MALEGTLNDMCLLELIQVLAVSNKTGRLLVRRGDEQGRHVCIYLADGEMVHAEYFTSVETVSPYSSGREAVFMVMTWEDDRQGDFVFDSGLRPAQHTIHESSTNLLLEGTRRLDEWKELSRTLPLPEADAQLRVTNGPAHASGQVRLSPAAWRILTKVQPDMDMISIGEAAGLNSFETLRVISQLLALGMLEVSNTRQNGTSSHSDRNQHVETGTHILPAPGSVTTELRSEDVDAAPTRTLLQMVINRLRKVV
jgi:hypothetical protein